MYQFTWTYTRDSEDARLLFAGTKIATPLENDLCIHYLGQSVHALTLAALLERTFTVIRWISSKFACTRIAIPIDNDLQPLLISGRVGMYKDGYSSSKDLDSLYLVLLKVTIKKLCIHYFSLIIVCKLKLASTKTATPLENDLHRQFYLDLDS